MKNNDSRYRENAKRISKMLAKKPFSSKQQLIKTVEFAAEFGELISKRKGKKQIISGPSAALCPQSIDMNLIEYHNLDIVLFFILLSTALAYVSLKVSCSLWRRCMQRKTKTE